MTSASLVVILTVAVICGLWIGAPLLRGIERPHAGEALQRDQLLTTYDRLLTNIRDLDEDFATGKIDAEAYQTEREILVQRGIATLATLDALLPARHDDRIERAVDRSIEEAVAAYRRKAHT